MSKELTEKWKNGEISGCYYWKLFDGTIIGYVGEVSECFEEQVCEVLAPVPSFDEYKELVRKSDKLDKIMSDTVTNQGDCQQIVEDNLNRQIARLQEQLNEANEALKELVGFGVVTEKTKAEYTDPDDWECTCVADEYLEKWGIPSEKCQDQGDFPSEKCKYGESATIKEEEE